jgi:hypothetical protein
MNNAHGVSWGFRCRDCPRARSYGAAKLRAEIEAGKHARKYDWHTVEVLKAEVVHVFSARDNQMRLDENEIPPF